MCRIEGCNLPRGGRYAMCHVCRNSIRLYGMSAPQREKMLVSQNRQCLLCEKKIEFAGRLTACIDHSHKTGKVRGILCYTCNLFVGHYEKNYDLIHKIENYISIAQPERARVS